MKKLLVLLLLNIATTFAQTTSNELSAEGIATVNVKPDVAILTIRITKKEKAEKVALKQLNEEIGRLQEYLLRLGFSQKNIKISQYSLDRYEDENEKEYTATNTLIVEFGMDYKLLDSFYQDIQTGNFKDIDIEFDTEVSIELEKSTRKKLVQLAIADAKANAENIANAINVKLNNVKSISKYGFRHDNERLVEEVKYVKQSAPMMAAPSAPSPFSMFEVVDKEMEESITIIYQIVKL